MASKQVDCTGVGKQKCYLVKEGEAKIWSYMYQSVEGFTYEPGYEYVLKVKKEKVANPPADASSIRYILEKVVSKKTENIRGFTSINRKTTSIIMAYCDKIVCHIFSF